MKEYFKNKRADHLNSRERLLVALNHREPDRVPIDLGVTPTSTISVRAHENLKAHLGIHSPTRMMSPIFLTAYPDEEIVRRVGVDVKMVAPRTPLTGSTRGFARGPLCGSRGDF